MVQKFLREDHFNFHAMGKSKGRFITSVGLPITNASFFYRGYLNGG